MTHQLSQTLMPLRASTPDLSPLTVKAESYHSCQMTLKLTTRRFLVSGSLALMMQELPSYGLHAPVISSAPTLIRLRGKNVPLSPIHKSS